MYIAKRFKISTTRYYERIESFVKMSGANLFLTFCQWMVILILNQNGDLSTVGEYGFVTGMIAPIYVASTLNFRNLVSTDSRNQYTMSEYTTVRIITLAIAFIVVCIQGIYSDNLILFLAFGLLRTVDIFNLFIFGIFEKFEKNNLVAISLIIRGFTTVIGIFLGTLISNQLWVGIFIQFMLQAVHSVVEIQQAKNLLKIKNEVMVFNRKGLFDYKIIHLIQLSVPMAYILSFRAFGENFPRYAIEQNLGFEALGVFTSIYYILYLFGRMGTSFIQVMLPRMTYNFNLGLFQSTRKLVIISIISCVSLGIISNLLLNLGFSAQLQKIILGSTSNEYGLLLNYFIIVISLKMGAHILIEFLTATRNFSSILLIGTIVSLSTIFSSSFFVPQYGLIGSIIALGIGAIIDVTLGLWFVLRNTSNRRKAQV